MFSAPRVVLASTGPLSSEQTEVATVATLRDDGVEAVYAGMGQSPEAIVRAVLQEDADVLGVYLTRPEDVPVVEAVLALLEEQGAEDVTVVVAGEMPAALEKRLEAVGVARVLCADGAAAGVASYVKTVARRREER